ncbi:TetR/AcrR family transcriptional regulator [Cryobacterium cryoconiti]|uniref:TetR/AcrR family transcriptional regulator n=1 Tax=Cryobacterium cryoconiti TaxID=1259239 RepID=A0A4Y8K3M5_9MICO|nr:TetR/AcrR family transcriptional regulator [Cryobacterium cryoconiti]TFD33148.1 TetR/AcrR family transcriptional regulator [Cryobacterium cryoconiti]
MSLSDLFGGDPFVPAQQVRIEPIQQRSTARLSGLLDAAAIVVDEVGFDRITTAMVAERAGASIGTVYRYYPDRVAVLQALRERAVLRFRRRVSEQLTLSASKDWSAIVDVAITAFVDLYRSEPGFRIMHFSDREGATNVEDSESGYFARRVAGMLVEEFGLVGGDELIFRLEVAVEMGDSILSRAFRSDPQGDERFIAECRVVTRDYLAGYYGPNVR